MKVTRQDVLAQQELVRATTNEIISILSLQLDGSSVHNVETYLNGMRVPVMFPGNRTIYIYALPWSRGWSVFTTDNASPSVYGWRRVPTRFRDMRVALYARRNQIGAHNIRAASVATEILNMTNRLDGIRLNLEERTCKRH